MKTIELGKSGLMVPTIAVGCMRINQLDDKAAAEFVQTALENGANFFDHADIYGGGECEKIFSRAVGMSPSMRENIILQSKCGIVPRTMFDFSKEHILNSVDGILKRLGTMNKSRLLECLKASELTLARQEWYEIYLSAGNILP